MRKAMTLISAAVALSLVAAACGGDEEGTDLTDQGPGPAGEAGAELSVTLEEQNDSGIDGAAIISVQNGAVVVEIDIRGFGNVHPVHIHSGSCADLGGVAIPLNDIEDGLSRTEIDATIDDLLPAPGQREPQVKYAINVHLSPEEADVYVACGDIL